MGRAAEVQKQRRSMASALLTVGDGGPLEFWHFGINQSTNQSTRAGAVKMRRINGRRFGGGFWELRGGCAFRCTSAALHWR